MTSLAPFFQLALELDDRLQSRAALENFDKIEAFVLVNKACAASLSSSAELGWNFNASLISLSIQVFCVLINDFSQSHAFLDKLLLE